MIKLQDKTEEQKRNKYVKHNNKVQNVKKAGATVVGAADVAVPVVLKVARKTIFKV